VHHTESEDVAFGEVTGVGVSIPILNVWSKLGHGEWSGNYAWKPVSTTLCSLTSGCEYLNDENGTGYLQHIDMLAVIILCLHGYS
jgi:hypothetical protein